MIIELIKIQRYVSSVDIIHNLLFDRLFLLLNPSKLILNLHIERLLSPRVKLLEEVFVEQLKIPALLALPFLLLIKPHLNQNCPLLCLLNHIVSLFISNLTFPHLFPAFIDFDLLLFNLKPEPSLFVF